MNEASAWVMIPRLDKDKTGCVLEMHPLVLCKYCRHYSDGFCYNPNTYFDDKKTCGNTAPDWFCADGEMK